MSTGHSKTLLLGVDAVQSGDSSSQNTVEHHIKAHALALGFDLVGIAPAQRADGFDRLQDWLAQGFAGDMAYMHGTSESTQRNTREHPGSILPEVRSVIMVALNYKPRECPHETSSTTKHGDISEATREQAGRIARYARGADYHDVLRARLKELLGLIRQDHPHTRGRAVVDTAPLLERDFARRAGLGWFGKNTMLLNTKLGSYFFLGALLVDLPLQSDEPFATQHCGTCTACLDACPTDAFAGPGWLDARRCISYLTIELRGPVDESLRPGMGDWLFGCDVCQEVCPWNRKAPATGEIAFAPAISEDLRDPVALLQMTDDDFRRHFKNTPLWRSRRSGLLRNAAIVLGNIGTAACLGALQQACNDTDETVRDAAQWALARVQQRSRGLSRDNVTR